jgi:hypothetical protein
MAAAGQSETLGCHAENHNFMTMASLASAPLGVPFPAANGFQSEL